MLENDLLRDLDAIETGKLPNIDAKRNGSGQKLSSWENDGGGLEV
jgi:hypothetical protein